LHFILNIFIVRAQFNLISNHLITIDIRKTMASQIADQKLDLERAREAEELKPHEEKLFNILHDLLQPGPTIEATDAAQRINDLFPANEDNTDAPVDENDPAEDPEAFLWSLWGLIIQVMRLVPPQHPGQGRMISFMESLREIPSRTLEIWGVRQYLFREVKSMKLTRTTERAEALGRFSHSPALLERSSGV